MKYTLILTGLLLLTVSWAVAQSSDLGYALLHRAQQFEYQDQRDSTLQYGQQAASVFRQQSDWAAYVHTLNLRGEMFRKIAQYDSSLLQLSEALLNAQSNQVPDTTLAETYFYLGKYYEAVRRPDQAIQVHEKAIALLEKHPDSADPLADSYGMMADVYCYTYQDFATAQTYYQQAVAILEGDPDREKVLLRNYLSLVTTLREQTDFSEALNYAFKALALAKKNNSINLHLCFSRLGELYHQMEAYEEALRYYQQGIRVSIAQEGAWSTALPLKYNNLGLVYSEMDSLGQATYWFNQSLSIIEQHPYPGSEGVRAQVYQFLGNAYTRAQQFAQARIYYDMSLQIKQQYYGEHHPEMSRVLQALARYHEAQQQYDSAAQYYQRALVAEVEGFQSVEVFQNPTLSQLTHQPLLFYLLQQKASALTCHYRRISPNEAGLRAALATYTLADTLMQICRRSYQQEMSKLMLSKDNKTIYEQAIGCAYQLYDQTQDKTLLSVVFRLMEKSKAILLWENLQDTYAKHNAGIPDSLLAQERKLKGQLAYLQNTWQTTTAQPDATDEQLTQLREQQHTAVRALESLNQTLKKRFPQYHPSQTEPYYSLSQMQAYAADHQTKVIAYFWGKESAYALYIAPKTIKLMRMDSVSQLKQTLGTYRWCLEKGPSHQDAPRQFVYFTRSASDLYQRLLAPFLEEDAPTSSFLSGLRNESTSPSLTIIPDGPLSYISFDALLTKPPVSATPHYQSLDYLLKRYRIGYAHSAQTLAQTTSEAHQDRKAMRFLAFGFSTDETNPTYYAQRDHQLASLPGTEREIMALEAMAEGDFYVGAEATEHQFKTQAARYDIIHLAIHGQADPQYAMENKLIFRHEQDTVDDGLLYAHELYALNLKADLAVLSTCESGRGQLQEGEGIYSIARGFAYAGCPSVVMSLWKINDVITARIMPTFYRALYQGAGVDGALRQAKLSYLAQANSYYAHPNFWASFLLQGNPAPVVRYQPTYRIVYLVLVISLVYGLAALYRWRRRTHQSVVPS